MISTVLLAMSQARLTDMEDLHFVSPGGMRRFIAQDAADLDQLDREDESRHLFSQPH